MEAQQTAASDLSRWLEEAWGDGLAKAIEGITGEKPDLRWQEPAEAPESTGTSKALVWEQDFDLVPGTSVWAVFPEEAWSALGARALRAAGVEEISSEEIKGTCVEILTQCHSALAQTIGHRLNRTVLAGAGVERGPVPPELACRTVRIQYPDAALAALQVGFSETLLAAIREAEQSTTAVAVRPVTGAPADPCAQASATLDLLRDIELPVSVSFGRAHLPLRDVLKLAAGSVIELDRAIEEPVALIVNDTVVALGEVVVVEGNYGVRIQQIMSREKLLTSSGLA